MSIEISIEEGNKLIAESPFSDMRPDYIIRNDAKELIGYTSETLYSLVGNKSHHQITDLKYHSSWDWLMPVVEKIKDIDNQSSIEMAALLTKFMSRHEGGSTILQTSIFCPNQTVYERVVQFIIWYNQNNKGVKTVL